MFILSQALSRLLISRWGQRNSPAHPLLVLKHESAKIPCSRSTRTHPVVTHLSVNHLFTSDGCISRSLNHVNPLVIKWEFLFRQRQRAGEDTGRLPDGSALQVTPGSLCDWLPWLFVIFTRPDSGYEVENLKESLKQEPLYLFKSQQQEYASYFSPEKEICMNKKTNKSCLRVK